MKIAYFTICSRNYLAYALTLRDSLFEVAPEASFTIFLADAPVDGAAPCERIINFAALALPNPDDMTFRYGLLEFNTAIKPFCFRHLFDQEGFDAAIYLDPDILILSPIEDVISALRGGATAVLTPHITAPLEDGRSPDDLAILRCGTFNLGFAAFANQSNARHFIDWWARQCETNCRIDIQNGLFVDQKFADFVPSFVEKTFVLRDLGYNVAYWNIGQRPIKNDPVLGWTAGGAQLRFFHFSGVIPGDRSIFSKHQNRFAPKDLGPAHDLLMNYLDRLEANDVQQWAKVAYAFGKFSDGNAIPPEARRIYARHNQNVKRLQPFEPFYDLLNAPCPDVEQTTTRISVFMHEIWQGRPDLQAVFPLTCAAGRRGFAQWFLLYAAGEPWADTPLAPAALSGSRGPLLKLANRIYRKLPGPIGKRLKSLARLYVGTRN